MRNRKAIGQAIGIVMERHCCIKRSREGLAVNLALGGAQPPQRVVFVTAPEVLSKIAIYVAWDCCTIR